MDRDEAVEELLAMKIGSGFIDVSLSNGLLRSSKELMRSADDEWQIFHGIDGTLTVFNLDDAAQVLTGERSVWDGTEGLNDFNDEEDLQRQTLDEVFYAFNRIRQHDIQSPPPEGITGMFDGDEYGYFFSWQNALYIRLEELAERFDYELKPWAEQDESS